ncbi:MmcQ/YjbR family DNA-binding protein [Caulobacter sp. KR2-114]|uniref:MmcQ/YjbR family DNA-binding protein n=1 Tax=Caulobacter sp. KR2-114 TaxID=3400912 RepID=UPI003C03CBE8
MTLDEIEAFCLSLPGASVVVQWGDDHVYKVGGKMFAVAGGRALGISFKASEMAFELLPETGVARPAPYLGRARWLQVTDPDALGDEALQSYLQQAHDLIVGRLPKKTRAALGRS